MFPRLLCARWAAWCLLGILSGSAGCQRSSSTELERSDYGVSFEIPYPDPMAPAPEIDLSSATLAAPEAGKTEVSSTDVAEQLDVHVIAPEAGEAITDDVYEGLRGTFTGRLPRNYELFAFVQDRYNFFLSYPPVTVSRKTQEFNQANVRLATAGSWRLHLCLAEPAAAERLHALAAAAQWQLSTLPPGVEILATVAVQRVMVEPVPLDSSWQPSGWMGDAEVASALRHQKESADSPRGNAYDRWTYDPSIGRQGWAAVAYQVGQFGDRPGVDLRGKGLRRITFSVRGTGHGHVRFKSGGNTSPDAKYPASYETASCTAPLDGQWHCCSLSLASCDLSNTVAALVFVLEHAEQKVTLDLADARFEGAETK